MPKVPTTISTYGYQHNSKALPQLYSVLNLDPKSEEAKTARNDLEALREKYLDPYKTTTEQKDRMDRVEAEILKQHPDLYGGSRNAKKMHFAMRTIVYLHSCYRSKASWKQKTQARIPRVRNSNVTPSTRNQKEMTPPSSPVLASTPVPISRASKENSNPTQNELRSIPRQLTSASGSVPRPNSHSSCRTPVHPRTQAFLLPGLRLATSTPRDLFNSSQPTNLMQSPTSVSFPPPSPSSLHAQSPPVSVGHGFTVVRNFLTSCRPSMEKYLYRFIDFGCKTEEYLSSIAAWDPERRDKVLKKILSQSNGTPLGTEMDIEVLQTQFEAYFS